MQELSKDFYANPDLGVRLLSIEGRRFLIGLEWDMPPISEDYDSLSHRGMVKIARDFERKRIDKTRNFSYVVIRVISGSDNWQFGFSEKGRKFLGATAAAGSLANFIRGSWIGIFDLPDGGFWFVQVNEELVVSDEYFSNVQEAKEVFNDARSAHTWDRVYVPQSWKQDHPGYDVLDYSSLLLETRVPKVEILNKFGLEFGDYEKKALVASFAFMGLLYYGHNWYVKRTLEQKHQQEIMQRRLDDEIKRKAHIVHISAPWYKIPSVKSQIDKCFSEIYAKDFYVSGYKISSFGCRFNQNGKDGTFISSSNRVGLTPQWAKAWADASGISDYYNITFPSNGKFLLLSKTFNLDSPRGVDSISSSYEVGLAFRNYGYLTSDVYTISDGKVEQAPLIQGYSVKPPVIPWVLMNYKITTSNVEIWSNFIESLNGATISSMIYSLQKEKWEVEGTVYAFH